MKEDKNTQGITTSKTDIKDANIAIGAGAGLGAYAGWTFSMGAVCPVCIIAAPALISMGLWGRYRAKKNCKENLTETKT